MTRMKRFLHYAFLTLFLWGSVIGPAPAALKAQANVPGLTNSASVSITGGKIGRAHV